MGRLGQPGGTRESAQRNRNTLINQPERMKQLRMMVDDGAPINEIKRTLAMEYKTIKKYAPDAGWAPGSPPGIKEVRKMKRSLGL